MNEVLLSFQDATTKVFFAVTQTQGLGNIKGDLTFDNKDIDIGDGFDWESGVVTVKNSGVYRFTFSGTSGFGLYENTVVTVSKNGNPIGTPIIADFNNEGDGNNISCVWMMQLNQGDTVELQSANHLWAHKGHQSTFTGELIYKQ